MHVWQNIRGVKNTDQLNTRSILNIIKNLCITLYLFTVPYMYITIIRHIYMTIILDD